MEVGPPIDVSTEQYRTILALLRQYFPKTSVWAYGSRARRTSRSYSDLDLVVFAEPGQRHQVGELREAFEESNLPFRVDLFVWDDVPDTFREKIKKDHIVLTTKKNVSRRQGKWPEVPLSQITTPIIGGTPTRSRSDYWGGNIPWATAKDVAAVSSRHLKHVTEHITEKGLASSAAKLMPEGTVIITARGTVGALAQLQRKMAFNQTCYAIQPKDGLDADFLYWALKGTLSRMRSLTYGSVFETITMSTFDSWQIPLPYLSEQCAIAHILGTLDDKIELNQKMNQTLEEIAKAIFKSWFVDFDPVRAKAEGRPIGLPPEISDLFPDELVDSEIGEIPRGWGISDGCDLYLHQKGLSYKGKYLSENDDDIPMLNLGSFAGNGQYRKEKLKFYCGDYKERHQIREGALLVANTDLTQGRLIIGSPILVPSTPNESTFYLHTHHTTKIIPKEEAGVTSIFLYFTFLQNNFRERVSGFATGTTVLALPKDTFDALNVILPPKQVRSKFEEIATPILERNALIAQESEVLSDLRDTLLPKLISGELRIPDAEKLLEEAGI